jgi:hypothetical protein
MTPTDPVVAGHPIRREESIALPLRSSIHSPANHLSAACSPWLKRDLVLLAILSLLYALPYHSSEFPEDAVRDLLAAEQIARSHALPSAGPNFFGGAFAFGPVWFYVLALPSLFGASFAVSAIYVGLIAALKLPLAFRVGSLIADRWLGWCLVAAICWPGAQTFQWIWWSTPNVVETCLWGGALCTLRALRDRTHQYRWWIASFLLLSLAVHAHPTALLYSPVLIICLLVWNLRSERAAPVRSFLLDTGAMSVVFGIPFLPTVPALLGTNNHAVLSASFLTLAENAVGRSGAVLAVLYNLLWGYPSVAWETWGSSTMAATLALGVVSLWHLATLAGIARAAVMLNSLQANGQALVARLTLAAGVLGSVGLYIVATLRPWVAVYTGYSLLPCLCLVQGGGLWLLSTLSSKLARTLVPFLVISSIAGFSKLSWSASALNTAGLAILPIATFGNLGDVSERVPVAMVRVRHTPRASKVMAEWICRHSIGTVHGTLALAMGGEHGLFFRRYCDKGTHPILLGKDPGPHAAGFPLDWFRLARRPASVEVDGIGLTPVSRIIFPEDGQRLGAEFSYFMEVPDRTESPIEIRLTFDTLATAAVAATSLKPWNGRTEVTLVTRNGEPVPPAAQTAVGYLWLGDSASPDGRAEWTILLRTDTPQWVDLVVF